MVDKIEMSLDDIIKSTKTMSVNKRGGAGGGGIRRGGKGGFRGGSGRGGSVRPAGRGDGANGNGVQKGRNRGGGIAKPKFAARVR